jgi:hypothetical protein
MIANNKKNKSVVGVKKPSAVKGASAVSKSAVTRPQVKKAAATQVKAAFAKPVAKTEGSRQAKAAAPSPGRPTSFYGGAAEAIAGVKKVLEAINGKSPVSGKKVEKSAFKKSSLPKQLTPFAGWTTSPTEKDLEEVLKSRTVFSTDHSWK